MITKSPVQGLAGQTHRLFEQVYDYILNRIESGEWKAHDKLPSVRSLAQELNVHRLTVFKAYQLLKQNGKVYVKDKSGYFVHPDCSLAAEHLDDPIISSYFLKHHLSEIHEAPVTYYSTAIDMFRYQGARIIPVDIGPDGYHLEQVEVYMKQYKPRLFYMNPTFQNPTGYIVPSEQRKKLVELAEQYRCLLVEDDPFRDIYFGQEPPSPLFIYDTAGCAIYIRSFSKYVAPGLRIAVVACRPVLMKTLLTAKSLFDNGTPLLNQKIFLHYFFSSRLQQHLKKLRIALHIRKQMMEEELASTDWKWMGPKGGLNLWVKLPDTISMDLLLAKSLEQSLSFVPGAICDPLKELTSWIRLSYSYVNEQQLREGVKRLVDLYQSLIAK
ncbi:hypothetical protein DNHGIG_19780 [Collibacillus ludicampi]|uniref:HTH gntR-type domain-containing protein n=1 Tax=Collibacillus ludicampi TaxID=2771369 RepID=A0AAV4LFJ8_9BACL|nr:PLP-dependent aminotransferase family protein [Collibacillus ludicampi]GIM46429.1 hypothetical protein DNHGIG_19780 [Collibacillus ludicampi]